MTDHDDMPTLLLQVLDDLMPGPELCHGVTQFGTWRPAAIEQLPPNWVNVRIWSYDETAGCNLYITEACPGVLYEESTVMETVLSWADADGEIIDEFGCLYDEHPVVVATEVVDPPARNRHFAGADWRPAYAGGGYLGSCPVDLVPELLAEHGQSDAVPRPETDQ